MEQQDGLDSAPKNHLVGQESEEHKSRNALSAGQSSNSVVEQGQSPVDDTGISFLRPLCSPPIFRQFWKAGNYDEALSSKASHQNGTNYLHVHPMFLHSNATSHKWVFGAVAELVDNAVDEIQNGATFVVVDKISNPRDGGVALLIQDDGGGMNPQAMRHCMGFGFSDKTSESAIGRYGNGFKTSTMRLGADAIVFSRHMNNGTLTQSIGLLSYTFLTQTGHNRIVVPIVDYVFNTSTGTFEALHGKEHFMPNLDILLQWSPYSAKEELLKQFDDIGQHGTKIIIYNLWFNSDARLELDFDSDLEDVRIADLKEVQSIHGRRGVNQQHIAKQFHYSLRVYLSILYLRIPPSFRIVLRGLAVEHHNIADDFQHVEYILYKPQSGGRVEGIVVTTIGFLKGAPQDHTHGFCVYHKNRLVMPYWQVVNGSSIKGRGVVGVLEANFVEPTHNKQDFERTSLLQKLENRLKEMTLEYWDFHCGLIGYQPTKRSRVLAPQHVVSDCTPNSNMHKRSSPAIVGTQTISAPPGFQRAATSSSPQSVREAVTPTAFSKVTLEQGFCAKRKQILDSVESLSTQHVGTSASELKDPGVARLMEENKKLRARYLEHKTSSEELSLKALRLRSELKAVNRSYGRLLAEFQALDVVKGEEIMHL